MRSAQWGRLCRTLASAALLCVLPACSGEPTGAVAGRIVVHVVTGGSAIDDDGYLLVVNEDSSRTVGPTGAVTLSGIAPGEHQLRLTGLAANCRTSGAPASVVVNPGATVNVTFWVDCATPAGRLVVRTITTGAHEDPDGYILYVPGAGYYRAGNHDEVLVSNLPPVQTAVSLHGIAWNCALQNPQFQTVSIAADSTVVVEFLVECRAKVGTIVVKTATAGSDIDADGYVLAVSGAEDRTIGTRDSVIFPDVPVGTAKNVSLAAVAPNCTVTGPRERSVEPVFQSVVTVEFIILCTAHRTLSFNSSDPEAQRAYTIRSDGELRQRIGDGTMAVTDAVWSPDGSRLAVVGGVTNPDIYVLDADGTNPRRITSIGGGFPSWSPDGTRIVFIGPGSGCCDIFVVNFDGSGLVRLTNGGGGGYGTPSFAPDGSRIIFHNCSASVQCRIQTMNPDGSGVRTLTAEGENYNPSYNRDGSRILFLSYRGAGTGQIYEMHSDGSNVRPLAFLGFTDWARYSPDDSRIAFHKATEDGQQVFVVNADGTSPVRVTTGPAPAYRPRWKP